MSDNNIQYIDLDDDDYLDAPKALREHVRKLQSALTETAKERDTLRGSLTSSALTGVLSEFKNPERVKSALLADKIDPLNQGAVEKWLAENGGDYAKGSATPPVPPANSVDPDEAAAHEKLSAGSGLRAPADMSKLEAALQEITPAMNGAEVEAVYRKHGL